jgi:hypothetical protein
MKKELIEKLLNEQTTPEEEHLVAQMLQQEEDMDSWLAEDETAEYDRIVNERRAKHRTLRWAVAAVIVAFIAVGAIVLWPREQLDPGTQCPAFSERHTSVVITEPSKPEAPPTKAKKRIRRKAAVSTTDSLQYYIARLEKELENVNESTYTAKAEEVLRADARLQKLVQRIMMGELTKDDVPAEAMNTNQTKEEQP